MELKNKPFGKTVRQELISHSAIKLSIWRRQGQICRPGDAIEAVIDGARPGTLGGLMESYVARIGELSFRRMECEIERKASNV